MPPGPGQAWRRRITVLAAVAGLVSSIATAGLLLFGQVPDEQSPARAWTLAEAAALLVLTVLAIRAATDRRAFVAAPSHQPGPGRRRPRRARNRAGIAVWAWETGHTSPKPRAS